MNLPPVQVLYNVLPNQYYKEEDWQNATHDPYEVFHSPEAVRALPPRAREDRFYQSVKTLPAANALGDFDNEPDDVLYDELGELHERLLPIIRQAEYDCGLIRYDRLNHDIRVDKENYQDCFDRTASYLLEDFRVFSEKFLYEVRRLLVVDFPLWRVGLHHYPNGDIDVTDWLMVYPDGYLFERYTSHEEHAANEAMGLCMTEENIGNWLLPWQAKLEENYQKENGDLIRQLEYVKKLLPQMIDQFVDHAGFIACFDRTSKEDKTPIGWMLCPKSVKVAVDNRYRDVDGEPIKCKRRSESYSVNQEGQLLSGYESDAPFRLIHGGIPVDTPDVYVACCLYDKRGRRLDAEEYVRVPLPQEIIRMDALHDSEQA